MSDLRVGLYNGGMGNGSSADVIVVGLGAHGAAAASALARRGLTVLGFDMYAPPHDLGSSHGETRVIREVYGEHPAYVPIVQHAYRLWRRLEEETDPPAQLLRITGGISIGRPESEMVEGVRRSAQEHNLPYELLEADDIRARWPQFNPGPGMAGAYDRNAGALFLEPCLRALLSDAERGGARLRMREPVRRWHPDGEGIRAYTEEGEYSAGGIVFAAGAWNRRWVSKLELPLRVERQALTWFQPAQPELFRPDRCPNHAWEWAPGRWLYCQPDFGRGVKVAFHHNGEMHDDPDQLDREVRPADEDDLREAVSEILPGLGGNILRSATCMYTDTPDEHFLLDRHPGHSNVIIVSACSGHGFKFSPAIGEIAADLVVGQKSPYDVSMFGIGRLLNGRRG